MSYGRADDLQSSSSTDVEGPAEALYQVRRVCEMLNRAAAAIERVQRHILRMVAVAQSAADSTSAQTPADSASAAGLLPAGEPEPSSWRADVAAEVRSIDQIAGSTESDGCHLLDGTWAVTLADAAGKGVRVLRVAEMSSRALGSEGIGGRLASLMLDADACEGNAVRVRDVSRCALLQAAAAREQILAFLRDAVEPLAATLEVTLANRTAADLAAGDLEFAQQASQLTPLDAMAQARPGGFGEASSRTFSIRCDDAADSPSPASSDNTFRQ